MTQHISKKTSVKEDNAYRVILSNFSYDLRILSELNVKLAKSIDEMKEQANKAFHEKVKNLDPENKEKFLEFGKFLDSSQPKENRSFQLEGELGQMVFDIANEGVILPNRFFMFIRDMGLVYLVAQFDDFIKMSLEITFFTKTNMLSTCKKSVTFEELLKYRSLKTIKHEIIQKEAEEVANKDIEELKVYFEEKMHIDISEFSDWLKLKERFYRRNILIHNSGFPNDIYKRKIGIKAPEIRKNERLTVSREYLDESILMFKDFASKLVESLENKFGKPPINLRDKVKLITR